MDKLLREAISDHKNGRLESAFKKYNDIIDHNPENAFTYRYIASLFRELNRNDLAIKSLQAAHSILSKRKNIHSDPQDHNVDHDGLFFTNSSISSDLASLLAIGQRGVEALSLALEAMEDNQFDEQAREISIYLLSNNGEIESAIEIFETAPETVKTKYSVCLALAISLIKAGRTEEAIKYRNMGLELPEKTRLKIKEHEILTPKIDYIKQCDKKHFHSEVTTVSLKEPKQNFPTLVSLENALVLSGEWLILTNSGTLLIDLNHGTPTGYPSYYKDTDSMRVFAPKPNSPVIEKAILVGGDGNYFHWTVDFFPLLLSLGEMAELNDIPILMHDDLTPYQHEALKMAKIDENRIRPLSYPGCFPCNELIVPLFPPDKGEAQRRHFRSKSLSRVHSLAPPYSGNGRRLYLSRKGVTRRRIINEDVLIDLLEKEGFEILSLQGATLEEQINIFSQADIVVGANGAAWGNMVYTHSHCRMVEINTVAWDYPYIENISQIRNQKYTKILTRHFLNEPKPPIFLDIYLTEDAIDQVLKAVN